MSTMTTTQPPIALLPADTDPYQSAVPGLLAAIESGAGVPGELYTDDAVLDATVPLWRLRRSGSAAIAAELSTWYRHPGRLERVATDRIADGVALEIDLTWYEDGVPHAGHQVHLLRLAGGRIASHTVVCGGRWPADLLAQMEAAGER